MHIFQVKYMVYLWISHEWLCSEFAKLDKSSQIPLVRLPFSRGRQTNIDYIFTFHIVHFVRSVPTGLNHWNFTLLFPMFLKSATLFGALSLYHVLMSLDLCSMTYKFDTIVSLVQFFEEYPYSTVLRKEELVSRMQILILFHSLYTNNELCVHNGMTCLCSYLNVGSVF